MIGKTIRINSYPLLTIGVVPPGYRGTQLDDSIDLWVMKAAADEVAPTFVKGWNGQRGADWLQVFETGSV